MFLTAVPALDGDVVVLRCGPVVEPDHLLVAQHEVILLHPDIEELLDIYLSRKWQNTKVMFTNCRKSSSIAAVRDLNLLYPILSRLSLGLFWNLRSDQAVRPLREMSRLTKLTRGERRAGSRGDSYWKTRNTVLGLSSWAKDLVLVQVQGQEPQPKFGA